MPPAPTCPRSNGRAGEGLASFLGGSGIHRSKLRRGPVGFRPGSDDPGRFPIRSPKGSDPGLRRGEPRRFPFRGPLARRLRSPLDLRRKWDRPRPHASSSTAQPSLPWLASRRTPPASAVVAGWSFSPFPEIRSSSRSAMMHRHSESRQAESGDSRLWITGISRISRRPLRPLAPDDGNRGRGRGPRGSRRAGPRPGFQSCSAAGTRAPFFASSSITRR